MTRATALAIGLFSITSLIAWSGSGLAAEQSGGGAQMGQKSGQGMSSQNPNDLSGGRDSHLGPQRGGDEGSQGSMRSGRGSSQGMEGDSAAHSTMKSDRMGQGEESGAAAHSTQKGSMQGDSGKGGGQRGGGSMGMGSGSGGGSMGSGGGGR